MRARNGCGTSAPSNETTLIVAGGAGPNSDALSILVADLPGNRVARVTDMNGANWETGPTASGRSFSNPWHIALDARGRIYVADRDNNRIVRMDDLAGNGWKTFTGSGATKLGTGVCDTLPPAVGCVIAVALDAAGRIYVTASGRVIRMDDMDGAGWIAFSRPEVFIQPKGLIVDRQGRIYVADADAHRIVRFDDMQATGLVTFGTPGSGVGQFNRPEGLALDALGRIYVTDNDNHRIVRINDMSGAGWVTFGSYGTTWSPRGPSTLAAIGQLNAPHDLAVSDSMKIYILDTGNGRIVRIDDMTGAGWTAFGRQPTGGECTSNPCGNPTPPGVFEFIAPKGIRLWQGHP
jgi:streptogramin lyase